MGWGESVLRNSNMPVIAKLVLDMITLTFLLIVIVFMLN